MQQTLFDWSEAQEAASNRSLINGQVSKPAHVVEKSADQLPLFNGHIDAHTEEIPSPDADAREWDFRIGGGLPRKQLLKWIGNKQRFAHEIVSYFPQQYGIYFEPFLGSGAVLGTLAPKKALASDIFVPLIEIWRTLQQDPQKLKDWYAERWHTLMAGEKVEEYEKIKASYNTCPNGADLLFLCRSCYGGVVRFRQKDGHMSTPCGPHKPMPPDNFALRVDAWARYTTGTAFTVLNYEEAMDKAQPGDLIYCDPPYKHTQSILYGAQSFNLGHLFEVIQRCKSRGVLCSVKYRWNKTFREPGL